MHEYKVRKVEHLLSNLKDGSAYAIIASNYLIVEPDAIKGAHLNDENDMFIIAENFSEAAEILNEYLSETIGRK